jgi:hypothetical protein
MNPTQSIAQKHFFFEYLTGKLMKQWNAHHQWVLIHLQWQSSKDSYLQAWHPSSLNKQHMQKHLSQV